MDCSCSLHDKDRADCWCVSDNEALCLKHLLGDLDIARKDAVAYCDNQSVIQLTKNKICRCKSLS